VLSSALEVIRDGFIQTVHSQESLFGIMIEITVRGEQFIYEKVFR